MDMELVPRPGRARKLGPSAPGDVVTGSEGRASLITCPVKKADHVHEHVHVNVDVDVVVHVLAVGCLGLFGDWSHP
jgi:hypothetical protein